MPSATLKKSETISVATQVNKRRGIDVGPGMGQVSPVMYWYKNGHFENEAEARGAFRLAYQQGLDGMGTSIQDWMGLSDEEFEQWMRNDDLPKMK